ncbi:unnamed protein product [Prorocentrum cordatum]|uniref:Uncharacterized protein n=1 Tax=Prorocentrum cordatum TaxID=2364126 RepID=A0ABN9Y3P5_9DINO|nr:unnamed protein product [Polarella glacialis]
MLSWAKTPLRALPVWKSARMASSVKIPATVQPHHKFSLASDGFMCLTYPASHYKIVAKFLMDHGAEQRSHVTDAIDSGITSFSIDGAPSVELFVAGSWEELHVTAENLVGETMVMGLAFAYRDFSALARHRVSEVLPPREVIT